MDKRTKLYGLFVLSFSVSFYYGPAVAGVWLQLHNPGLQLDMEACNLMSEDSVRFHLVPFLIRTRRSRESVLISNKPPNHIVNNSTSQRDYHSWSKRAVSRKHAAAYQSICFIYLCILKHAEPTSGRIFEESDVKSMMESIDPIIYMKSRFLPDISCLQSVPNPGGLLFHRGGEEQTTPACCRSSAVTSEQSTARVYWCTSWIWDTS